MSRFALAITAVVGLLVAAFVAVLVLLDNPEAYKKELSQTFETQTGYGLEINGDLNWQYFPPIAIGMTDVAVTIPGVDLPLASVGSANIDLKVIPLLFGGSVEVSGISIDGLTVNATVDNSGKGNWEVSEETGDSASTDAPGAPSEPGGTNLQIDIGGVSITNTEINYSDLSTQSDYQVLIQSLTTGPLGTGTKTDIAANLTITDKTTGMVINNDLSGKFAIDESLSEFVLEALEASLRVEQPEATPLELDLVVNAVINTTTEQASITNTSASISGASFLLDLEVEKLFGNLAFNGKLSAADFNAQTLLTQLDADPGPMANANALSKVNISGDITGTATRVQLNNLTIGLDDSNLTGKLMVNLEGKTSLGFDLNIDQINASDYLSPSEQGLNSESSNTTTTEAIEDSEVLPIETLSEFDIDGKFSIGTINYETWVANNFNLTVSNQRNNLNLTGTAAAYQGNIDFSLDSQYANTPGTRTRFTVSGVDIAQALETQALTGSIELTAAHSFQGKMMSDVTETLDGDSAFNIANGTLDVRPIKQLAAIVDSVQGTQSGLSEWPDLLPFDSMNGKHAFNSGLRSEQTFNANLENMQITGEGGIDYFANTLNYDIEAVLLENVGGQFTVNEKLAGIKWPLHCEGDMSGDPVSLCLPDRSAITDLIKKLAAEEAKRRGKDAIQKKIDEVVPDELKDAAKGLLKGIFGN